MSRTHPAVVITYEQDSRIHCFRLLSPAFPIPSHGVGGLNFLWVENLTPYAQPPENKKSRKNESNGDNKMSCEHEAEWFEICCWPLMENGFLMLLSLVLSMFVPLHSRLLTLLHALFFWLSVDASINHSLLLEAMNIRRTLFRDRSREASSQSQLFLVLPLRAAVVGAISVDFHI